MRYKTKPYPLNVEDIIYKLGEGSSKIKLLFQVKSIDE